MREAVGASGFRHTTQWPEAGERFSLIVKVGNHFQQVKYPENLAHDRAGVTISGRHPGVLAKHTSQR